MKKEKIKPESSSQVIISEDEKKINDTLIYEKWRDDGKYDHKKRDIGKKLKKLNAAIIDRKDFDKNKKPSIEQ